MAPSTEHEQQHDERVEGDDPTEAEQALENLSLSDPAPNEALRAYSGMFGPLPPFRLKLGPVC